MTKFLNHHHCRRHWSRNISGSPSELRPKGTPVGLLVRKWLKKVHIKLFTTNSNHYYRLTTTFIHPFVRLSIRLPFFIFFYCLFTFKLIFKLVALPSFRAISVDCNEQCAYGFNEALIDICIYLSARAHFNFNILQYISMYVYTYIFMYMFT